MNDVFISYSRRDKVFTQKLFEALKAENRSVWADWEDIPAASDWDAEIKEGIEQTESVLFLLSPEWIKSNECRKELNHAVSMGKRLIPILYQMVDPNCVPPELAKINWVYMRDTDDFGKSLQTLCSAMDTDLDWIKTHTRIQVRAVEWNKKNRENSFVLRGKDLADAEKFTSEAAGKSPEPTQLQGEYILASRKDATRRQRITLAGVTIALVISIILGVAAVFQRQAAVLNAKISFARELSAQAANNIDKDPELSLLLAQQAIDVTNSANQPVLMSSIDALRLAVQNSRVRLTIDAGTDPIESIAVSPNGKYLVSGGWDGTVRVFEVTTGKEIARMNHDYAVYSVAFSPDGKYVASGSLDFTVSVWETTTGKEVSRMTHDADVWSVDFSPDGKYVVSGSEDKTARVWVAATGEEVTRMIHEDKVHDAVFSPDGKHIATTSFFVDGKVQIWDTATGALESTFSGGICPLAYKIDFSPDGESIGVSGDCIFPQVVILNVDTPGNQTKDTLVDLNDHKGSTVYDFVYSPDGTLLASGGADFTVIVVDLKDKSTKFKLYDTSAVYTLAFGPDGKYIVTGNQLGQIKIWSASSAGGDEAGNINLQKGAITALEFNPEGKQLAVTTVDLSQTGQVANILSMDGGDPVLLAGHTNRINDIAFSSDGKKAVTGSSDCTVKVWDAVTGDQLLSMGEQNCGDHPIRKVSFSPDNKYVAGFVGDLSTIGDQNSTVIIWDASTGKQEFALPFFNFFGSLFSPDGDRLLMGFYVYEFPSQAPLLTLSGYQDFSNIGMTAEIFSPDGKQILMGFEDGTVNLWDAVSGEEIRSFFGHTSTVANLAFSPDGTLIATASKDRTAKIWDAASGTLITTISPSAGPIIDVAFSPDGNILALGNEDGVVRFYFVNFKDLAALAKTRITRPFTLEECKTYLHVGQCPGISLPTATAGAIAALQPDNTLRSGNGITEITLQITNYSNETLKLYWVDYDGVEKPYGDLIPNLQYEQTSTSTNVWRVRDQAGDLRLEYVATEQAEQII